MEITGKIDTERAATVGIITYDNPEDEVNASLDELERLLETAGGRAVIRLVQSKENPDVRTFLGSGKMKELAELCRGNDVTLVVCDSELSPSQIRNMWISSTAAIRKDRSASSTAVCLSLTFSRFMRRLPRASFR